jgi:PAS domain S-box-containing protein
MQYLKTFFDSGPYLPHGYCLLWNQRLISLHAISDLVIALFYFSISFTLVSLVHKRRHLPSDWMVICLAIFVVACTARHSMDIWTVWHANYWLSGSIKAVMAVSAVPTAILLVKLIPDRLAVPSLAAMRLEIVERKRAEEALNLTKMELELRVEEKTREWTIVNDDLVRETEQRQQLQQTLKDSEEQLRMAQEASGLGVWDWDPRADRVVWSAQHCRIFGLQTSQNCFDLLSVVALIHPEDQAAVQLAIHEALRPGGELETEYRIIRQDGQTRWMLSKGRTHCDDQDRPFRMIGVTLDVNENRQAAEALRRSEDRFRLLVEGISDYAIYMLDPNGLVTSWNDGAKRIMGYEAEDILRQHFSCFYSDQDIQEGRPELALREAAAEGRYEEDGWLLRKDGSRFSANAIVRSLRDQRGGLIGFAKVTRDLTESRRAEEALHAAQAELARVARVTTLGELCASIAHEIKQPLAAIVNNANASRRILENPIPDLKEVRQIVEDIAEAGTRAAEIISRIRALLKRTSPDKRPLDINKVVHEVLRLVRNELEQQHVSVELELEAAPPPVLGDRVQLQQVLLNLILNGIEAMNSITERPRVLMLQSHSRASELEVTVQDCGPGLDPRHVPYIFNTFFTTKTTGMGMGLSISRSIIEAHGGRLWASPDRAAQGAAFLFSLPIIT